VDKRWIPRGLSRCSLTKFLAWLTPWTALLVFGVYAAALCLFRGLNQTNMDNRFAFGLWIFLDLTIIALGAGAFFSGFLLYLMKREELRAVINTAVVAGFVCYSGAIILLMVDVGQPLRAWFTFWHPNVHSMLTEVTFCITCYLAVLSIEYIPVLLRNRRLKDVPSFLVFEHELHKAMPVFAAVGAFLSFFHQGSLGGLYGVLRGRPFAFRENIGIWPTTFFLFILSAIAAGPAFLALITWAVEIITRKRLVKPEVYMLLGKLSGLMMAAYVGLKSIDTLIWMNNTSPRLGFAAHSFYRNEPFGTWLLVVGLGVCGLAPALVLLTPKLRARRAWLIPAAALVCCGVALNRFALTIQTLAAPTLPFDEFMTYAPSWQEYGAFLAVVAYGVLLYSVSFRYLPLFPQERELSNS
jgi:menaquinone reductase, integral membrane subunit